MLYRPEAFEPLSRSKRPEASAATRRGASSGGVHGASSGKFPSVISVRTRPGLITNTGIRPPSSLFSVSP